MRHPRSCHQGFALVELIIAMAVMMMIFGSIIAGAAAVVNVVAHSKAKSGGLSVATSQLEYVRSLSYDAIGTVGGVPEGLVPQHSTSTQNGIEYVTTTLVQYVDAAADGLGDEDENDIITDHKEVKVTTSWDTGKVDGSLSLSSVVVPRGIESSTGGGTIKVQVFDATVAPVGFATVRFVNERATTTIDTVRYTNVDGVAYLSGAPALADYQVFVSKDGFSSDQTYQATTANPNPSTLPVAVVAGGVSTLNFQIDELSDVRFATYEPPQTNSITETFVDGTGLSSQSNVAIDGGNLELATLPGGYASVGEATSVLYTPSGLVEWGSFTINATTTPDSTVVTKFVYDDDGVTSLVPDADLSGNSSGFTSSAVDLSLLSVTTYPALGVMVRLETTDASSTPQVADWTLGYTESQAPLEGVSVTMVSAASIGTTNDGDEIPKHELSGTTDGAGEWSAGDEVEYGAYELSLAKSGYSLYEVCPFMPLNVSPGSETTLEAVLGPAESSSLLVYVADGDNTPISGATVELVGSGVDTTATTSACGQVFFGDVPSGDAYEVSVAKSGYESQVVASTTVGAAASVKVIME